MSKEEKIREMCKLIILHISSKKVINTSFAFRNIFSNLLGFIVDEASIIHELLLEGKLVSDGVFDNSTFYKSVSCTEKGKKYYNDNIHKIDIIESDFPDKKLEMLQFYLGLKTSFIDYAHPLYILFLCRGSHRSCAKLWV